MLMTSLLLQAQVDAANLPAVTNKLSQNLSELQQKQNAVACSIASAQQENAALEARISETTSLKDCGSRQAADLAERLAQLESHVSSAQKQKALIDNR